MTAHAHSGIVTARPNVPVTVTVTSGAVGCESRRRAKHWHSCCMRVHEPQRIVAAWCTVHLVCRHRHVAMLRRAVGVTVTVAARRTELQMRCTSNSCGRGGGARHNKCHTCCCSAFLLCLCCSAAC